MNKIEWIKFDKCDESTWPFNRELALVFDGSYVGTASFKIYPSFPKEEKGKFWPSFLQHDFLRNGISKSMAIYQESELDIILWSRIIEPIIKDEK